MNKLLTNFPVTLTEEQKNVLKLTLSAVLQDDPVTKYWRPTVYENGDIMWSLVASESDPLSQNIKGPSGFTPHFQIDQSTAEWQVTYDGTSWTPLGIIASGAQGPQGIPGQDGTNGTNGTSVHLDDVSTVAGGTQVTLGWGTSETSAFVIPSGAAGTPGTNGKDGVSPTVTTSELSPTEQHPQGGFAVTIIDETGSQTIDIWNGNNGAGATVRLLEGTGIKIEADGSDYTIGVSADYALKTELPDVSDMATKTWVSGQNYLTSIPDSYATKTYANEASAYALSQAESWVEEQRYLPTSGGTVSGQLVVSGGGTFDQQFLKIMREGVNGYARLGLGQFGALALKTDDNNGHTTQINVSPNATNDQLVQVQHNGGTVGYLIPATTATTTAGLTNDGILHIILES